jgi:hypothetical protein
MLSPSYLDMCVAPYLTLLCDAKSVCKICQRNRQHDETDVGIVSPGNKREKPCSTSSEESKEECEHGNCSELNETYLSQITSGGWRELVLYAPKESTYKWTPESFPLKKFLESLRSVLLLSGVCTNLENVNYAKDDLSNAQYKESTLTELLQIVEECRASIEIFTASKQTSANLDIHERDRSSIHLNKRNRK